MTNVDSETPKVRVAKHELLDAQGAICETEEAAAGARYTILANGKSVDYKYGDSQDADRMYALFGFKTLMTNESSQVRNSAKGDGGPDAQFDAAQERHTLVGSGTWIDRTREPGERALDKNALFNAVLEQFESEGKTVTDDQKDKVRQMIEEDKKYLAAIRKHPEVMTRYNAAVGRVAATKTTDDLLAAIS